MKSEGMAGRIYPGNFDWDMLKKRIGIKAQEAKNASADFSLVLFLRRDNAVKTAANRKMTQGRTASNRMYA